MGAGLVELIARFFPNIQMGNLGAALKNCPPLYLLGYSVTVAHETLTLVSFGSNPNVPST